MTIEGNIGSKELSYAVRYCLCGRREKSWVRQELHRESRRQCWCHVPLLGVPRYSQGLWLMLLQESKSRRLCRAAPVQLSWSAGLLPRAAWL